MPCPALGLPTFVPNPVCVCSVLQEFAICESHKGTETEICVENHSEGCIEYDFFSCLIFLSNKVPTEFFILEVNLNILVCFSTPAAERSIIACVKRAVSILISGRERKYPCWILDNLASFTKNGIPTS